MAHASNAGRAGAGRRVAAQFEPFDWIEVDRLDPSQQGLAALLNTARDIVQGTQTLTQLLTWDEDNREATDSGDAVSNPQSPLLNHCQRSALQRLIAASLDLLHARIEAEGEALAG